MTEPASKSYHLKTLTDLSNGFMPSRIFLTAIELGVFQRLHNQPLIVSKLSKLLDTDERSLEILLNALVGIGLLEKDGDLFAIVDEVADFLTPGSANYQGASFAKSAYLYRAWSHLTETVKSGKPFKLKQSEEIRKDFAISMKLYSQGKTDNVIQLIDCSGVNNLLDLGGGVGTYAIAFAKSYPHINAVIFEYEEETCRLADEEICNNNLQNRIKVIKGDFFVNDIGSNYDLVILSKIICLFCNEDNSALFRKINNSLNDGGRVLIIDSIIDESGTKPDYNAIFSVNMLVTTDAGHSYSFSEVKEMLSSSQFKDICRFPMDGFELITGKKDKYQRVGI